jgi:NADPH:quinone reductase-like Zn-dependent oxidoreductase
VKTAANSAAATVAVLRELASLIDSGQLEIPIAKVYGLDQVRDAYRALEERHTLGKIVLEP